MVSKKVVLTFEVWRDIQQHFVVYGLLIAVISSAFAVIYLTHINRQGTSQMEALLTQRDELDIEWRNLLLEQNSLAEHSAIESKAVKLLNMARPTAQSEIIIKLK